MNILIIPAEEGAFIRGVCPGGREQRRHLLHQLGLLCFPFLFRSLLSQASLRPSASYGGCLLALAWLENQDFTRPALLVSVTSSRSNFVSK